MTWEVARRPSAPLPAKDPLQRTQALRPREERGAYGGICEKVEPLAGKQR
jgi:hypothetical protein